MIDKNKDHEIIQIIDHINNITYGFLKRERKDLYDYLVFERTNFLPRHKTSMKERLFCLRNNITNLQKCPICNNGFLSFDTQKNRYSYGCCHKCTLKTENYKREMRDKYGCESPNQSQKVKSLKIKTLRERYGVENSYQIKEVKDKKRRKSLRYHGTETWNNREKARDTYLRKTGYENASYNPKIKIKKKETCLKNSGKENPSQRDDVKKKKIETCLRNNGLQFGFLKNKHVVYRSISKLNERLYNVLEDNGIKYIPEFKIFQDNGHRKSYDVRIERTNLIIEVNGDFWHANPRKYNENQVLNFPHLGKIVVKDVWKRDEEKRLLAEKNGFRVLYLWESDMKKMKNEEIFEIICKNINYEYNITQKYNII